MVRWYASQASSNTRWRYVGHSLECCGVARTADPANKIDLASGSGIQRVLYVVFCSALFFQVLVALDLGFADADLARRIVVRIPQRK